MSADQVDSYVRDLEEPKRTTLQELRRTILEIVPEAEEGISYGIPAFRLQGQVIAGFAAFKSHLSYLPFSGSVLGQLADELQGYARTKSSLHFPVDRALPKTLVKKLIAVRLADADLTSSLKIDAASERGRAALAGVGRFEAADLTRADRAARDSRERRR